VILRKIMNTLKNKRSMRLIKALLPERKQIGEKVIRKNASKIFSKKTPYLSHLPLILNHPQALAKKNLLLQSLLHPYLIEFK
jgi:hypothetical protein